MSVYIKGMEMPIIEMEWTLRHRADGKWYVIDTNAETSDGEWHEIIPIPPHGRLIDADALLKRIAMAKTDQPEIADVYDEEAEEVEAWLSYAPTIIPTSEEGE